MVSSLFLEALTSLVVVLVVFAFVQFFSFVVRGIARRAGAQPAMLRTIRDALTLVGLLLALAGVFSVTGLASEVTTLTLSGIVGIVVSLALQTTLTNMISGILLFYDKAIRLGDDIEFSGVRGKIVRIGLRSTWVRTQTGEVVVMSNSNLSGGPLVNYTAGERIDGLGERQDK